MACLFFLSTRTMDFKTLFFFRATVEEMRSAAAAAEAPQPSTNRVNSSMQANLVTNAQPISFTGSPLYDSNV